MKIVDMIRTSGGNLFRSKIRTLLTVTAVVIGAMTITLTNGIGSGIKSYLDREISSLGSQNILAIVKSSNGGELIVGSDDKPKKYNPGEQFSSPGSGGGFLQKLPLMRSADLEIIRSVKNISSVEVDHILNVDYISGNGEKYQIELLQQVGTLTTDLTSGIGASNASTENQLTIPERFVQVLGDNREDVIGKSVKIAVSSAEGQQTEFTAKITGIQRKSLVGGSAGFVNSALGNKLYQIQQAGLPNNSADSFITATAIFPTELGEAEILKLKDDLKAKGYDAQTVKDQQDTVFTAINAIIIVFNLFGAIALLAASFGIINTLYMAVQERTKEIGLMKALGMSRRKIFQLFSMEACLIGFLGSTVGVALALLVGLLVNNLASNGFLKGFPGLTLLTFPLRTMFIVIFGVTIIAFLAGTLPALRASRKNPIDALRYE